MSASLDSGTGSAGPGEELVSPPNLSAFFMRVLIFLVTTVASMRHTIIAPRHRDCQTRDHVREGKAGLFCSSGATHLPYPHPGKRVASCPSLTLQHLL